MVNIEYDRKNLRVTVKGHAGSGEHGHDLVCAAVSALVYTLAANVAGMAEDKRRIRRPTIRLNEGDAEVACSPIHGMTAVTTLVFDTICAGFEIIARDNPRNVRYQVVQ